MIYSDIDNNVNFNAYYDEGTNILHVLDNMAVEPRMSVTNGIDELVPVLENHFKMKENYRIFLYGTDSIITEFDNKTKDFTIVDSNHNEVFDGFKTKMENLYGKSLIRKE